MDSSNFSIFARPHNHVLPAETVSLLGRLFLITLFTCCLSPALFGQSYSAIRDLHLPAIDEITPEVIDIKAENWNNHSFNAYRDALVKFPFQLEFTDSIYASPMHHDLVVHLGVQRPKCLKGRLCGYERIGKMAHQHMCAIGQGVFSHHQLLLEQCGTPEHMFCDA